MRRVARQPDGGLRGLRVVVVTTPTPDRLTEDRAAVRETFDRLVHEDVVLRWDGASRAVMVLDDAFAATARAALATHPEPGELDEFAFRNEVYRRIGIPVRKWLAEHPPSDKPGAATAFGDALFHVIDKSLRRESGELDRKIVDRLVEVYNRDSVGLAYLLDEQVDQSGNLLGWLRDAVRARR